MTDPRPCPTGWSYLEIYPVQRGHAQVNQQQIINCKNRYFLRVRETSQNKTSPPQTSIGCFLEEKLIYVASSLIILKQARHNSWRPNFALYPAGASAKKLIALKKTYQLFTLTSTVQSSSDFIPVMVWSASTSLYMLGIHARNSHPKGDGGSGRRPLPPDHMSSHELSYFKKHSKSHTKATIGLSFVLYTSKVLIPHQNTK